MYTVGLTGGIGSGKSVVAERFKKHQVTVINSDHIAREVVEPGSDALKQISKKFGSGVLADDGSLNRAALRGFVFDNEENRQWLEGLLHPLIGRRTRERKEAPQRPEEAPYRILESPLLIEVGRHNEVDRVLLIDTHSEVQIARVMQRDNCSREQALAILNTQMSGEEKKPFADDIIDNSSSMEDLYTIVDELHQKYCQLALQ